MACFVLGLRPACSFFSKPLYPQKQALTLFMTFKDTLLFEFVDSTMRLTGLKISIILGLSFPNRNPEVKLLLQT